MGHVVHAHISYELYISIITYIYNIKYREKLNWVKMIFITWKRYWVT